VHDVVEAESARSPVTVSAAEGLIQIIRAGDHRLVADEPASRGGTGTGPTPYGLLLSALGACTSMTLRMYASHKGWPLTGVRVELSHDRVHARDFKDIEGQGGRIDRIRKRVHLEGPLSEEQRARLHQISSRCPVHRTLAGDIRIESAFDA
jgi:uncharacterized OsmC-like protein